MSKVRLDLLLVERDLVESRNQAQKLIMAGQVRVDDQIVFKPSTKVLPDAALAVDQGPRYVSRGGDKLAAALDSFQFDVKGLVCADVGTSTGGFTDCLLQHGAARVYAIDVAKGILHWKIRQDPRVVVMEKQNARYLERLPEPVSVITVDASFISLQILLPVFKGWFQMESPSISPEIRESEGNSIIALIKPQFEAGREEASRGRGVIRDPAIHRQVLSEVLNFSLELGYGVKGLIRSPLRGPKGNVEFLAWLEYPGRLKSNIRDLIAALF
jgi:23S rRNA (cytidine1920-2'-O)/16S rRNA (cytidine1409-2'-O)-methyltransferase